MLYYVALALSLAAGIFSAASMLWLLFDRKSCPQYHPVPQLAWWLSALLGLSWAIVYVLQVAS